MLSSDVLSIKEMDAFQHCGCNKPTVCYWWAHVLICSRPAISSYWLPVSVIEAEVSGVLVLKVI